MEQTYSHCTQKQVDCFETAQRYSSFCLLNALKCLFIWQFNIYALSTEKAVLPRQLSVEQELANSPQRNTVETLMLKSPDNVPDTPKEVPDDKARKPNRSMYSIRGKLSMLLQDNILD